jgi:hypothetical protein
VNAWVRFGLVSYHFVRFISANRFRFRKGLNCRRYRQKLKVPS